MLHKSSLFKMLITKTKDSSVASQILNKIKEYEENFEKKVKLQNVNKSNYAEVLNNAIEYIEHANNMKSWTKDLRLNIMRIKIGINKRLEAEEIKVNKMVELHETLKDVTSKTERTKMKSMLMKEQLLELEQMLDEAKSDLECAEMFEDEAKDYSELTYAYYQAVKTLNLEYNYN